MLNESSVSPAQFLGRLFCALRQDGFNPEDYPIDHVCYRVADQGRYEQLKVYWNALSEWHSENLIAGRPIAVFRLLNPFVFESHTIPLLELAAPRGASDYPEGFEHAEFVVGNPLGLFLNAHPGLPFDRRGCSKPVNPEVRLKYDGFCAKFHEFDLEYVIRYLDPS